MACLPRLSPLRLLSSPLFLRLTPLNMTKCLNFVAPSANAQSYSTAAVADFFVPLATISIGRKRVTGICCNRRIGDLEYRETPMRQFLLDIGGWHAGTQPG